MAAASVHPTAILDGDVELADDVQIGPHCVLSAPPRTRIAIGRGTRILGHAHLHGPLAIASGNTIYPFATLGFPPQDLKWDPDVPGAGLTIGDGNTFRESVTIHRATSHETPTRIGSNNYWMANSHAGHDCTVGSHCIFANGTLLAGFVTVGDRVITGGNATVHQFCRIGRGAMLSGTMGLSLDLPPFFMLTAGNICGAVNVIGLRRSGMPPADIDLVKWIYRVMYRMGYTPKKALEALRGDPIRGTSRMGTLRSEQPAPAGDATAQGLHPLVREYIEFIETSKRGICPAHGKPVRGTA